MPLEHPSPTEATVKYLYAHAFRCAYEGCRRPLYRVDEQTGIRTLNSRVSHINARSENGPRWDAKQSSDENRSEQNLILMCVEHAATIDDPLTVSAYPGETLRAWKRKQLEEYDQLKQGWIVDSQMSQEVIRASFSDIEVFVGGDASISLGGEGGKAPGAGGGGGGAIGRGARGGRGGDGGGHRIDESEFTLPWETPKDQLPPESTSELEGNPGAGGGGRGAIGDGARGGDGGGGGEHVSARIDVKALRSLGFDRIEYVVGKGGEAPRLPGQHGVDGEDTIVNFLAADGTVLKSIRASSGRGAKSGGSYLPEGVTEISPEDLNSGFQITTLMAVNSAEIRDGLLYVLGGDWERYYLLQVPTDAVWSVVCAARWNVLEKNGARGIFLSMIDPAGREVACQNFVIPEEAVKNVSWRGAQNIGAVLNLEGNWVLQIHSGGFLLAEIRIHVLLRPQ